MIRNKFDQNWEIMEKSSSSLAIMSKEGKTTPVVIPHDAMIHEKTDPNVPGQGQTGFYPGGQYVYVKNFEIQEQWKEKLLLLEFEGIYQTAMVYVNGHFAGSCLNGYVGFTVELNPFLNYNKKNEIKVIANNMTEPNNRWYSGSGIYRDVNLLVGSDVYIPVNGVKITTEAADSEIAMLSIETELQSRSNERRTISIETIVQRNNKEAGRETTKVTIFPKDSDKIMQKILIHRPELWDCESPNLYDVIIRVKENDVLLEESRNRFGIRTLQVDPVYGLRINGKEVKLRGACIHQDNGILGAAAFYRAGERKIEQLKNAGFNSIRSCHQPMDRGMLSACDKLGMLVMDELSDVWNYHKNPNDYALYFQSQWEKDVKYMVDKDYNHASVIFYSAGNEIPEIGLYSGARTKRKICNLFHTLDPTRYTTDGMNATLGVAYGEDVEELLDEMMPDHFMNQNGANAFNAMMGINSGEKADYFASHKLVTRAFEESTMAADIIGLNYLTGRHLLEKELHPNRTVIGTETFPADIVRLWGLVKKNQHILGNFTWAGYDYLGEAGCGIFHYDGKANFADHYPERLAYIGDLNLLGYRRPISYLREIVYGLRKEPYIAVERVDHYGQPHSKTDWMFKDNVESWTWPGYEGKMAKVDVYADAQEVELFLNGRSMGRKPAGEAYDFTAAYEIKYEPGELTAVSYTDEEEIGRFCIRTAEEEIVLDAKSDRNSIQADGKDLAFITVKLKDRNGIENLFAVKKVKVRVEGNGCLLGFGSANPQPVRSYDESEWETFDGEVMAVVKAGNISGKIHVFFSAEDCDDVCIEIEAV